MISSSTTNSLPIELWRKVLRHVTQEDAIQSEEDLSFHPKRISHTNIRMKVSLIHVCQRWRAIGSEFLWETVANQSQKQLIQIADFLSATSSSNHHSRERACSVHPGWWIRSLHTRFDFGDNLDVFVETIDRILRLCPNLHTFMHIHDFNGPLPPGVVASLATHCGRTLRRFQLDWGGLNTDDLTRLLESAPELVHVSVGCTFAPPQQPQHRLQLQDAKHGHAVGRFRFDRLRSVHFGNREDGMTWRYNCHLMEAALWVMPSLTTVSIDIDARTSMEEVLDFLESHGPLLTSLSVTDAGRVDGLIPPLTWTRIFTLCPHLVELCITFNPFLCLSTSGYDRFISSTVAPSLQRLSFANWEFFPLINAASHSPALLLAADADHLNPTQSAGTVQVVKQEQLIEQLHVLDKEFSPIGAELTPALRHIQFDFQLGNLDMPDFCRPWWDGWLRTWQSERNLIVEGCNRVALTD